MLRLESHPSIHVSSVCFGIFFEEIIAVSVLISRRRMCNFEPVGPAHIRHVIPALCGHSEREWWSHPGLLRAADDRAVQALAQHLIFSGV